MFLNKDAGAPPGLFARLHRTASDQQQIPPCEVTARTLSNGAALCSFAELREAAIATAYNRVISGCFKTPKHSCSYITRHLHPANLCMYGIQSSNQALTFKLTNWNNRVKVITAVGNLLTGFPVMSCGAQVITIFPIQRLTYVRHPCKQITLGSLTVLLDLILGF